MRFPLFKKRIYVKVEKELRKSFIDKLRRSSCDIYNFNTMEDVCSFTYFYVDENTIKNIIVANELDIIKEEKIGVFSIIPSNKTYISYFVGIFIFAIIIANFSLYIWNIDVLGNDSVESKQIISFLEKQNIYPGVKKESVFCEELESAIRKKFSNISWVCIEIKGNCLQVHINEQYKKDEVVKHEDTYNLIAKSNTIIESIVTRSGTPLVKKGDVVKQNDVLISGVVNIYNESGEVIGEYYNDPDGDVYGRTTYYYKDSFDINYKIKEVYDKKNNYYLKINGFRIGLKSTKEENNYIVTKENGIKLFGDFYLPIRYGCDYVSFYNEKSEMYDKKQTEYVANKNLEMFLKTMEEKEMQILEKNVKIYVDDGKCITEGTITVIEPIAQVQPFIYSQERTTDINECN